MHSHSPRLLVGGEPGYEANYIVTYSSYLLLQVYFKSRYCYSPRRLTVLSSQSMLFTISIFVMNKSMYTEEMGSA